MKTPSIKPHSKGLQAIIFDMDDTMVPTMKPHFNAWADLCLKHKPKNINLDYNAGASAQNLERIKNAYNGCTSEEFVGVLFGPLSTKIIKSYAKEREDLFIKQADSLQEINGLTKFLESCGEIKKGIASSTSYAGISHVLEKLGIGRFFKSEHIIDSSKVKKGKPNPDPYIAAAKTLNVLPNNCLVFEDSKGGIKSAQSAGMKVIGVATSIPKEELLKLGVTRAINDYTEIKNLEELQNLFNVCV